MLIECRIDTTYLHERGVWAREVMAMLNHIYRDQMSA